MFGRTFLISENIQIPTESGIFQPYLITCHFLSKHFLEGLTPYSEKNDELEKNFLQ